MKMILLFCVFLLLQSLGLCSKIEFTASPSPVLKGLTEAVTLRCSLLDTATSASVVGRRDTESTPDNVDRVSSIIVMQNGVDLATVSQNSVHLLVNSSNTQLNGDISKRDGERGFLEVKIQYPSESQVGEYDCEITAFSSSGHGVIFKTPLDIKMTEPTIADLVSEFHNAKNEIHNLQQTIAAQKQNIGQLQSLVNDLMVSNWSQPSSGLQVRLLGGVPGTDSKWGRSYGTVQLRYNGTTGMLCDDYFNGNNNGARVVCKMLGFSDGVYADGNLFMGETGSSGYDDLYLLDDVQCSGTEADLTQCHHNTWGKPSVCGFAELAGVRCT